MAMTTIDGPVSTAGRAAIPNGAALASFLGAGIGAFAMGVFVVLNEADIFAVPAVYAPAGGLSGRTTSAVVVWLIAWGVLHQLWKDRNLQPRLVHWVTLMLIAFGIVATFPPVWSVF